MPFPCIILYGGRGNLSERTAAISEEIGKPAQEIEEVCSLSFHTYVIPGLLSCRESVSDSFAWGQQLGQYSIGFASVLYLLLWVPLRLVRSTTEFII